MPDHQAVVIRHPEILGGRPTFRGTRVQVEILFENLADGYSLDEIVDNFPTLDREDLRQAILQAGELVKERAPRVASAPEDDRARVPG